MAVICTHEPMTIAISTDLHYLAKRLYEKEKPYAKICQQARNSEYLLERLLEEMDPQTIDIFLLTGDLTLNGERESHQEFIKKLNQIKERGIQIFVLPGNHDIRHQRASKYVDGKKYPVSTISESDFRTMYAPFGYDQALSVDENSLSYVVALSTKSWLICLDNCCRINEIPQRYGQLKMETFTWLEQNLKCAKEQGISVYVAGHYNLAYHNQLFRKGFTMRNHGQISKLLHNYGVQLFFSGHMHMQHMSVENDVMDIATSSLTTYPHQYGVLTIDQKQMVSYHTKQLSLSKIERRAYYQFYYEDFIVQVLEELEKLSEIDWAVRQKMAFFAAKMNLHYFGGTFYAIAEEARQAQEWKLWKRYGIDLFFYQYLQSMFEDSMLDHNKYIKSKL